MDAKLLVKEDIKLLICEEQCGFGTGEKWANQIHICFETGLWSVIFNLEKVLCQNWSWTNHLLLKGVKSYFNRKKCARVGIPHWRKPKLVRTALPQPHYSRKITTLPQLHYWFFSTALTFVYGVCFSWMSMSWWLPVSWWSQASWPLPGGMWQVSPQSSRSCGRLSFYPSSSAIASRTQSLFSHQKVREVWWVDTLLLFIL